MKSASVVELVPLRGDLVVCPSSAIKAWRETPALTRAVA
jgi:hypothetical protein